MGWNPIKDAEKAIKKIDKERRNQEGRLKSEAERIAREVEKANKSISDNAKEQLDKHVRDIDRATGVNVEPIVKAIAGPAHILAKIAEGHNLSDATTDWVVNQVEGAGEIGGILGDDVEKIARTIVSYANVPVLVLVNFQGDTVRVIEGKETFGDLTGTPLKAMLEEAYAIYDKEAEPLPIDLKMVLSRVVDKSILNRARVVIDRTPDNVAGLANALNHKSSSKIHAVTVDDIIIFSGKPNSDLGGYLHWVHELTHVDQYKRWGMLKFASNYTKDYDSVESEAIAAAVAAKPVLEELFREFT